MPSHPGSYVGTEDLEADTARFATLQATPQGQFAENARLTNVIRQRLASAIAPDERADA